MFFDLKYGHEFFLPCPSWRFIHDHPTIFIQCYITSAANTASFNSTSGHNMAKRKTMYLNRNSKLNCWIRCFSTPAPCVKDAICVRVLQTQAAKWACFPDPICFSGLRDIPLTQLETKTSVALKVGNWDGWRTDKCFSAIIKLSLPLHDTLHTTSVCRLVLLMMLCQLLRLCRVIKRESDREYDIF
jgi:hypothetical protein